MDEVSDSGSPDDVGEEEETPYSICEGAWHELRHRGIEAAYATTDLETHRLQRVDAALDLLAAMCLPHDLGNGDVAPATRDNKNNNSAGSLTEEQQQQRRVLLSGLSDAAVASAMDAVHDSEEHFSRALFDAVVRCFREGGGGWRVLCQQGRHKKKKGRAPDTPETEFVFDDMVLLGRSKPAADTPNSVADESFAAMSTESLTPSPTAAAAAAAAAPSSLCHLGKRKADSSDADWCGAAVADTTMSPPGALSSSSSPVAAAARIGGPQNEAPPAPPPPAARRRRRTIPHVRRVGDALFAMGLCRKSKANNAMTDRANNVAASPSILNGGSFPDHAWVIYKKKVVSTTGGRGAAVGHDEGSNDIDEYNDDDDLEGGEEWTVHRLLASVELKTNKTSGMVFDVTRSKRKRGGDGTEPEVEICRVDIRGNATEHGPLAQELAYIVGHALPGRVGLGLDLPPTIPFAVVAGKCSETVPTDALLWLHGTVVTPDVCGGGFYYSVDAFESFQGGSGRHALAAYLDVMLSGFEAGQHWLANRNHLLLPPKPLSGRIVQFGSVTLDGLELNCSPLDTNRAQVLKASQGELFKGNVNLTQLLRDVPDSHSLTWCRVASPADSVDSSHAAEALIPSVTAQPIEAAQQAERSLPTVSSRLGGGSRHAGYMPGTSSSDPTEISNVAPCFTRTESTVPTECLPPARSTDPVLVKVVSRACFGALVGTEGLLWNHFDSLAFRGLRKCLSPSLHAVYIVGSKRGLVQLMPDLSQTFKPLRPCLYLGDDAPQRKMWTAFANLVKEMLIPLAEARVVHLDLRPGYNCTANILYDSDAGEMRLIDLDSLILYENWSFPLRHPRYLDKWVHPSLPSLRTALEFLFFQVAVITDAWIGKITDLEAHAAEIASRNEMVKAWRSRAPRAVCDRAFILRMLEDIGVQFGVLKQSA
jgi:hypothetical protein